jgi:hypothetical protein
MNFDNSGIQHLELKIAVPVQHSHMLRIDRYTLALDSGTLY